jgi:hypothetical protein
MRETEKIWMTGERWRGRCTDPSAPTGSTTARECSRNPGVRDAERHRRLPADRSPQRLENSARLLGMDLSFSVEDLRGLTTN